MVELKEKQFKGTFTALESLGRRLKLLVEKVLHAESAAEKLSSEWQRLYKNILHTSEAVDGMELRLCRLREIHIKCDQDVEMDASGMIHANRKELQSQLRKVRAQNRLMTEHLNQMEEEIRELDVRYDLIETEERCALNALYRIENELKAETANLERVHENWLCEIGLLREENSI